MSRTRLKRRRRIEDDDEFEEVYQAFEERLSDLFFDDERTDSESEEDGE